MAYGTSIGIFYIGDGQLETLDDYLMGSRSCDVPVKIISERNAERYAHTSDVVTDTLFRLKICSRLHRHLETQQVFVRYVISAMNDERGEKSNRSVIMTGYRGHVRPSFISVVKDCGFSAIFIIPKIV